MPAALPAHVKEQAVNLMLTQGLSAGRVAKQLNLTHSTVRNWERECNAQQIRQHIAPAVQATVQRTVQREIDKVLNKTGDKVREGLAEAVAAQAKVLQECPPLCVSDLQTNPERQGLANTLKTVVEAASAVFGWSKDGGANGLSSLRRFDEAIDVTPCESTEVPAGEPKQVLDVPSVTDGDSSK